MNDSQPRASNQQADSPAEPHVDTDTLGNIYQRAIYNVEKLLPAFAQASFPTQRKQRKIARDLQALLHTIAQDLISSCMIESSPSPEARERGKTALWRAMHALSYHLSISHLAGLQPNAGIWQLLHASYKRAGNQGIAQLCPAEASCTYQNLYFATLLAGCGQPAAFSPQEARFLSDYLSRHSGLVSVIDKPEDASISTFWIDAMRDSPATPCSRKAAPLEPQILCFDCNRLATQIKKQLAALHSGSRPEDIELDGFAGTPAGQGALRRLAEHLGNPGKRRFPRRRQHYRAVLCTGLKNLWQLFSQGSCADIETSSWMITNESPDGYSIMHVLGDASDVSPGNVVAIRAADGDKWQVCITRWTRTENQEHLEFGLQILAVNAIPAMLVSTTESKDRLAPPSPHPVLLLPKIPPLRNTEMLIAPSGLLGEQPKHFVLIIEQGNIAIREARSTQLNEQSAHIEIFLIEPDTDPALPAHATQRVHPQ